MSVDQENKPNPKTERPTLFSTKFEEIAAYIAAGGTFVRRRKDKHIDPVIEVESQIRFDDLTRMV